MTLTEWSGPLYAILSFKPFGVNLLTALWIPALEDSRTVQAIYVIANHHGRSESRRHLRDLPQEVGRSRSFV
jgi:hypothetical protein